MAGLNECSFLLNLESETLDPCIALHEIFTEIINSSKDVKAETEVKVFVLLLKLVLDLKTLAVTQLFFQFVYNYPLFQSGPLRKCRVGERGVVNFLPFSPSGLHNYFFDINWYFLFCIHPMPEYLPCIII